MFTRPSKNFKFSLASARRFPYIIPCVAGLAQLVARHLAKVEVAGSNPVARSMHFRPVQIGLFHMAKWPSGKARACKALTPGSNPGFASRKERHPLLRVPFLLRRVSRPPLPGRGRPRPLGFPDDARGRPKPPEAARSRPERDSCSPRDENRTSGEKMTPERALSKQSRTKWPFGRPYDAGAAVLYALAAIMRPPAPG